MSIKCCTLCQNRRSINNDYWCLKSKSMRVHNHANTFWIMSFTSMDSKLFSCALCESWILFSHNCKYLSKPPRWCYVYRMSFCYHLWENNSIKIALVWGKFQSMLFRNVMIWTSILNNVVYSLEIDIIKVIKALWVCAYP